MTYELLPIADDEETRKKKRNRSGIDNMRRWRKQAGGPRVVVSRMTCGLFRRHLACGRVRVSYSDCSVHLSCSMYLPLTQLLPFGGHCYISCCVYRYRKIMTPITSSAHERNTTTTWRACVRVSPFVGDNNYCMLGAFWIPNRRKQDVGEATNTLQNSSTAWH